MPGIGSEIFAAKQKYSQGLQQAQSQLAAILPFLQQQFGMAQQDLSRSAGSARRGALDAATQAGASAEQGLTSRGFGGATTLRGNIQRGVSADLSRSLTGIESALGGQMAGLRQGFAGQQAGAMGNLSDFIASRAGIERQLQQQLIDHWRSKRARKQAGREALGGALGTFGIGGLAAAYGLGGEGAVAQGINNQVQLASQIAGMGFGGGLG